MKANIIIYTSNITNIRLKKLQNEQQYQLTYLWHAYIGSVAAESCR